MTAAPAKITQGAAAPLTSVIGATVQAVREFAGTCPQSDDITVLALRLLPGV